jgi:hypothetical protein
MGEFSAHRITISPGERVVIATQVNLYVSPFGDDVLNSGVEEDSPFRTPNRAIEWLGDKYISDFGFVTINFAPGIYELDDQLIFDHEQGNRVAFVGAAPKTLLLQYVSGYVTSGYTTTGLNKFYSGVVHGITMSCVLPDDNTTYAFITSGNALSSTYGVSGSGVIIEDYDLVYDNDYNPAYFYAAYPYHPRNNIAKQGSILGSHKLTGLNLGTVSIQSSVRDDWFCIPAGSSLSWGRMYGNPQFGVTYISGACANNPADRTESETNAWFIPSNRIPGPPELDVRGHYLSSVPVGYYGGNATTGIPVGATTNFIGATFPNSSSLGLTATFVYEGITQTNLIGWYSATGPAGSFLNDTIAFGKNYHEHAAANGYAGLGGSGAWRSINTNRVTVKIMPTVFKRYGNILKIGSGGLRKIKNIFMDGINMPAHYALFETDDDISSNKYAIYSVRARLGETVINEPAGLGDSLCSNVGVKDFHVGFFANNGSDVNLGKIVVSNCSYGVIAANRSSIVTTGSVVTGAAATAFGSYNSSSLLANRCFASFVGQSRVAFRIKGSNTALNIDSFIPGQTYTTPDQKIRGTVWSWNPRQKLLNIAVKVGLLEGGDPVSQHY